MSRIIGIAIGITATIGSLGVIMNEGKRNFYEDESEKSGVPGTTIIRTEQPNDPILYDGVAIRTTDSIKSVFLSIRQSINSSFDKSVDWLENGKNLYLQKEQQFTATMSSLHHRREDLFPNCIYILIGGLTGQIITRQRSFFARTLAPVALGLASFYWFLPETFKNTAYYAWKIEQRTVPQFASQQANAFEKAGDLVNRAEASAAASQQSVVSSAEKFKRKFARFSGLNIDDDISKK